MTTPEPDDIGAASQTPRPLRREPLQVGQSAETTPARPGQPTAWLPPALDNETVIGGPDDRAGATDNDAPPVEAEGGAEAEMPEQQPVARDLNAYGALASCPVVGDAGRQQEIVSAPGELTVGVSDTELDFLTVAPFEVRACTTRGFSHRYAGTPRQDAFAIATDDQHVVLAVADGVSQGRWSHVAAETASRAAVKLVMNQAAKDGTIDWDLVSRQVSVRVVEEAEYRRIVTAPGAEDDINERINRCRTEMATTLVVVCVSRRADVAGAHVVRLAVLAGDSGIYKVNTQGIRVALGGKSDGDSPITSSAVRPLPGAVEPDVDELALVDGEALILVSDGLGDPIGDGSGEVGREIATRWLTPPTIDRFLLDVNFFRRSFDDDRTAVGVWLLPALQTGGVVAEVQGLGAHPSSEPDSVPDV